MATWKEDADSRAVLGPGTAQQNSTLTFSASDYPSNGYPVVPATFGLGSLRGIIPVAYVGSAEEYRWAYDASSLTLKAYNGTSQVSASSNFAPGSIVFQGNGLG